ncbi:hypothetical protein I2W78_02405 [Streptomyces spinoverrucosus]|uniref:hypothetical protein n=1 Tax=Streptomyces spinoverrucosus TaxID=284043 RepID=UPI0018C3DC56|nr:hypothetical protein [Streptomyces spinoverrucosus]MBG0850734.1 hypothetical protein [Streptomyces spinoverrucosus]
MTDHRHEEPGRSPDPVPRDLPDQQAVADEEDPWEVTSAEEAEGAKSTGKGRAAADVPDADEAGAGRQGAPRSATVHPEHPAPDESPD